MDIDRRLFWVVVVAAGLQLAMARRPKANKANVRITPHIISRPDASRTPWKRARGGGGGRRYVRR